ncbi:MAG: stage III sporulation protein D [Clostridia bacterium]|nr:stage III sporulation protein D [Clostridia bacterium]
MDISIEDRVFAEAEILIRDKGTVRSLAKRFNVSKSTVHFDLSKRLKRLNLLLFKKVDDILKFNLSERHIRGGVATKIKYFNLKQIQNINKKFAKKQIKK